MTFNTVLTYIITTCSITARPIQTRCDTSDNECRDLQNCRYSTMYISTDLYLS